MAVIISSVVGTQSTYDLLAEHSKREGIKFMPYGAQILFHTLLQKKGFMLFWKVSQ